MNISYIGRKTTVKDNFKDYCDRRLKKLDKFFDDDASATVVVSNESSSETVEVTIRAQGMFFRAERTGTERHAAIDDAVDVLQKQIVRNKSRYEKKVKSAREQDFEALGTEAVSSDADVLVKTKKFSVAVMDPEEAILRMNLLGHEFFMFRSAETGEINVIYRRHDGNYGLLEPIND